MSYVPPSGEVLAEEIQVQLAESIPREEQGELIYRFVRTVADAIEETWQAMAE